MRLTVALVISGASARPLTRWPRRHATIRLRLGVVDVGQRLGLAEILDQPREVGRCGVRLRVVLPALVPQPRGNVVNQQRRARPLHRLHQRLGLVALYGFDGFGFLASCAARRAVKPMTIVLGSRSGRTATSACL